MQHDLDRMTRASLPPPPQDKQTPANTLLSFVLRTWSVKTLTFDQQQEQHLKCLARPNALLCILIVLFEWNIQEQQQQWVKYISLCDSIQVHYLNSGLYVTKTIPGTFQKWLDVILCYNKIGANVPTPEES